MKDNYYTILSLWVAKEFINIATVYLAVMIHCDITMDNTFLLEFFLLYSETKMRKLLFLCKYTEINVHTYIQHLHKSTYWLVSYSGSMAEKKSFHSTVWHVLINVQNNTWSLKLIFRNTHTYILFN